jgi:hypothetical protein
VLLDLNDLNLVSGGALSRYVSRPGLSLLMGEGTLIGYLNMWLWVFMRGLIDDLFGGEGVGWEGIREW